MPSKLAETPQLNKVFKHFSKKEGTPQPNKVFKVFYLNGNASKVYGNASKKANSYCLIKIRAITLIVWMQRRVEKNTKKGKKKFLKQMSNSETCF